MITFKSSATQSVLIRYALTIFEPVFNALTMSNKYNNNYVSPEMSAGRIVSKGKITDLSKGFRLKEHKPFSVYVRPKTLSTLERDVVLKCKLYAEEEFGDVPVTLFSWVELCIIEIAPSDELLNGYDIYWGAGSSAETLQHQ